MNGRHDVEFEHYSGYGENKGSRIVLDAAEAAKTLPEILRRYGVPVDRSSDLPAP